LGIPYAILDKETADPEKAVQIAVATAREQSGPYALVVRGKTFKEYQPCREPDASYPLTREEALQVVLETIGDTTAVVSTTGMTSREVFEYRAGRGQAVVRDFLTVGSMGHASQIALGIALGNPRQAVCCIDGDGAALMHLGSLAIIGSVAPRNFRHVLVNNGAHDSVGGQPSAGFKVDFPSIASACGYTACRSAQSAREIANAVQELAAVTGPTLLEIKVRKGSRKNLGRPAAAPSENKIRFMEFLRR
jgi:phosphonopyruvate decarboxylase